jgi:hypothetical protein
LRASILLRMVDFYIALAVLAFSSGGVWYALARTNADVAQANLVESPVYVGKHEYKILSHEACVGGLQVTLERLEGEINLFLRGDLRTESRGKALPLKLEGDLSFNMLGQLGGGLMSLLTPEFRFSVGVQDINPIKVTLISTLLGGSGRKEISVPGPVELLQTSKNSYQLRYAPLAYQAFPAQGVLDQYSTLLGLRVVPVGSSAESCGSVPGSTTQEHLVLDQVADSIEKQVEFLSRFLPQELLGGGRRSS